MCEPESSDSLWEAEGGEENSAEAEGGTCAFFARSRPTSNLKSETAEVVWLTEHLQLSAVCSLSRSLSKFTFFRLVSHIPQSEETLTETLLPQWMVSKGFLRLSFISKWLPAHWEFRGFLMLVHMLI